MPFIKNKTIIFTFVLLATFQLLPFLTGTAKVSAEHRRCYTSLQQGNETFLGECPNQLPGTSAPGGQAPDPTKCYYLTGAQLTATSSREDDCSEAKYTDPEHAGAGTGGTQPQRGGFGGEDADNPITTGQCRSSLDQDCSIVHYLQLFINVLSAIVGIVIALMFAFSGLQYMTSRDNAQQTAVAKTHMLNAIIGLILYLFLFSILQWLVPGGLF